MPRAPPDSPICKLLADELLYYRCSYRTFKYTGVQCHFPCAQPVLHLLGPVVLHPPAFRHPRKIAQHTAYIVQYTAAIAQHTADAAKRTGNTVQHTADVTLHTADIMQHTAEIAQRVAAIVPRMADAAQRTADNVVRCAVTLHALAIGCTCCHATWHVPHSTALQSTTSAKQCSLVGTHSYRDSLWL